MKKESQKSAYFLVGTLSVMVVGLTIAFAALSTTLKINFGKVTQSAETWNVGFKTGNAVAAVATGGTSGTGRTCGTVTTTATTATITDTQLSKPGDSCTWKVTVQNTGTIDAKLGTVTPTAPTSVSCSTSGASMVCGNITYKLATNQNGATLLTTGGTLAKTSGVQDLYILATYTGGGINTTAVEQSNASFTLVYNQA